MKIQKIEQITKEVTTEFEVNIEEINLHVTPTGIHVMVELEDLISESADESVFLPWSELLSWCLSSSQDHGDSERICYGLRAVANELEKWGAGKNYDDLTKFKTLSIDEIP